MKKLIAVTLAAVLCLSLCACGIVDMPPNREFSLGTVEGLKYENKFIGIGCELDTGWSFKTEEEIRELNNFTQDMMDKDLQEALKNATVVYDMMAMGPNQADNIIVNLEKVPNARLMTLDLAKNCETLFPSVESSLKNVGYTNITHSIETVKVGGKDFTAMKLQASLYGASMYQTNFFVKCNGYLASVAITTMGINNVDNLLSNFYIAN